MSEYLGQRSDGLVLIVLCMKKKVQSDKGKQGANAYLVSIHHQDVALVIPNGLTGNGQSLFVILQVSSDLQLEVLVPLSNALAQKSPQLVLAVSEPASTGRVRGHGPALLRLLDTLLLAGLHLPEQSDGLLRRDGIGDVPEVDAADKLLGAHLGDDAPDRLAKGLRPQVPERIDNGSQGKMDHPFLGPDPPQLAVGDQVAPRLAPVGRELVQVLAHHQGSEKGDRGADDFVSAANSEGLSETVSNGVVINRLESSSHLPFHVQHAASQCSQGSRQRSNHPRRSWRPSQSCRGRSMLRISNGLLQ